MALAIVGGLALDPAVGWLRLIVTVALQIKKAVETARQNKEDCDHVVRRVDTLCERVRQLEKNAEVMNTPMMQSGLKSAVGVLDEVLRVVNNCQKERSTMCVFLAAGKLSRQLSRVDGKITTVNSDITDAELAYLRSRLPKPCQPLAVLEGGEKISNQLSVLHSSTPPTSLPQQITEVARQIKEASKSVRRRKADFMEIEKRASDVSALLPPLESYTELVNQETTRGALNRLLHTFGQVHTLVMAYQGTRIDIILWPNGKLVKQPHDMLDQMLGDISAVNIIVMNGLHGLQRDQGAGMVKDRIQVIQDDLQDSDVTEVATSAQDQEIKST